MGCGTEMRKRKIIDAYIQSVEVPEDWDGVLAGKKVYHYTEVEERYDDYDEEYVPVHVVHPDYVFDEYGEKVTLSQDEKIDYERFIMKSVGLSE